MKASIREVLEYGQITRKTGGSPHPYQIRRLEDYDLPALLALQKDVMAAMEKKE